MITMPDCEGMSLNIYQNLKKSMFVFQNDGSKKQTQKEMKDHTESNEIT